MSLPSFLQLIRWKNILLMGYLLGLLNWIFVPRLDGNPLDIYLFTLFTLAILAIQAGGYIINDIFDKEIDQINKPHKMYLTDEKSVETARKIYRILNIIGIVSGIWFSMQITTPGYSIVFIGATLLLFYYAKTLKSRFIIGNLLVAFLSILPIIILVKVTNDTLPPEAYLFIYFVFMLSLVREIVKDAQDIKGDYKYSCKTIPIVLGTSRAVQICRILLIVISIALILLMYVIKDNTILKLYIFIPIIFPLLWLMYQLDPTKKLWNFKLISTVLKVLFFIGMNSIYFI